MAAFCDCEQGYGYVVEFHFDWKVQLLRACVHEVWAAGCSGSGFCTH